MSESRIFEKVLFVGMDYKIPKGGIASVLNTYSTFIHPSSLSGLLQVN